MARRKAEHRRSLTCQCAGDAPRVQSETAGHHESLFHFFFSKIYHHIGGKNASLFNAGIPKLFEQTTPKGYHEIFCDFFF